MEKPEPVTVILPPLSGTLDVLSLGDVTTFVGALVGLVVGALVGSWVGSVVGALVGSWVGSVVGSSVGSALGAGTDPTGSLASRLESLLPWLWALEVNTARSSVPAGIVNVTVNEPSAFIGAVPLPAVRLGETQSTSARSI
uniref:glycine zipper 2TM domain-containing protein n=1 Tax=Paeniglutamicibacter gangotriensis TaxID=254787 RepID=UPI0037446647